MTQKLREKTSELARARRALRLSGRRLMKRETGGWVVLAGSDRRRRALAWLQEADGQALVSGGEVVEAEGGGYVLAAVGEDRGGWSDDDVALVGPALFHARGFSRVAARGRGFVGLVRAVGEPGATLSLRQAAAGLRLVADAEASARTHRLGMDWSAAPSSRARRGPRDGGLPAAAKAAAERIARMKRVMPADRFAMAWSACVDGATLSALEQRGGLPPGRGGQALAAALEMVAAIYDGTSC